MKDFSKQRGETLHYFYLFLFLFLVCFLVAVGAEERNRPVWKVSLLFSTLFSSPGPSFIGWPVFSSVLNTACLWWSTHCRLLPGRRVELVAAELLQALGWCFGMGCFQCRPLVEANVVLLGWEQAGEEGACFWQERDVLWCQFLEPGLGSLLWPWQAPVYTGLSCRLLLLTTH